MTDPVQPAADGDRIAAVRFRPTPTATAKRRAWLSPWRLAGFVVLASVVWFLWFIFTAKSVRLEATPASAAVDVDGGFAFRLGDIYLLREGDYRIRASAQGYADLIRRIDIGSDRNQTIPFTLTPLPGRVTFAIDPPGATVVVSGGDGLGGTAPVTLRVPAGPQAAHVSHPRYENGTVEFEVTGRDQAQTVTLALLPNWADVTLPTTPSGAPVRIGDELSELSTPGPIPILAGEHRIVIALPGYKPWTDIIFVEARHPITLAPIVLDKADGTLAIESSPKDAGVTVGGVYAGVTPLSVGIDADRPLAVSVFKVGYAPRNLTIELASGQRRAIDVTLTALTATCPCEPARRTPSCGSTANIEGSRAASSPSGRCRTRWRSKRRDTPGSARPWCRSRDSRRSSTWNC